MTTIDIHIHHDTALSVAPFDDVQQQYALLSLLPLASCHELSEHQYINYTQI